MEELADRLGSARRVLVVGNGGIAMEFVYAVLVVAPPLMSQRTIIGSVLRRGVAAAG